MAPRSSPVVERADERRPKLVRSIPEFDDPDPLTPGWNPCLAPTLDQSLTDLSNPRHVLL